MCDWINSTLFKYYYKENNLPNGWIDFFKRADIKNEILKISKEITRQRKSNPDIVIYPPLHQVFKAFELTSLENLRVYISGQDPYHNGSAVGLAFSVKEGNNINPSLINIYKKLESEYPEKNIQRDGNLEHWAEQGVFLINSSLTVEQGVPNSHKVLWIKFYKILITYIAEKTSNSKVVYLLLGAYAHKIVDILQDKKIICTSHPSPLGVRKKCGKYPSFLESRIFTEINEYLDIPIDF